MTTGTSDRRRLAGWAGLGGLLLAAGIAVLLSGALGGGDDTSTRPYPLTQLEQKAEDMEDRVAKQPGNGPLLRLTMRAWIAAGGERATLMGTEAKPVLTAASEDYEIGLRYWNRYLHVMGRKANPDLAEQAGNTYFLQLELGSRDLSEIEANAAGAAQALRVAGRQRSTFLTLTNEAIYEYYNGEFAAGDRAARAAEEEVPKQTVATVKGQFAGYRKRAEFFRGQLREAAAELRQSGNRLLAQPLKAYKDSLSLNTENPAS